MKEPWLSEPNRVEFKYKGFDCLINRVIWERGAGHLCGYVAVKKEHPAYGKGYDDVAVDIHGGLSYSNKCSGEICHKVEDGEDDNVWWLGFDCAHYSDYIPGQANPFQGENDTYRTIEYVKWECESLVDQLLEMK